MRLGLRYILTLSALTTACSTQTQAPLPDRVLLLADASTPVVTPDSSMTLDARPDPDAGFKDAETPDSGVEDAGFKDAGFSDAEPIDTGLIDAGPSGPGPFSVSTASATQTRTHNYDREITAGNPLKGFLTSYQWTTPDQRIPHQMEFLYLPVSAVLTATNTYDFTNGLEPHLNASAARGNHLVIRFFLDYPGRPSGVPAWLSSQIACNSYTEFGGGCSPDYNDPRMQSAILGFISEFGARYDGDSRLGFIQLGLIGFWGEWHTYPHTNYFASNIFQRQVMEAFDQAFDSTRLLIRYPIHDSPNRDFGFHDDSFAYATIGTVPWFFHPRMVAAGADQRWQQGPIGGEVYPQLQDSIFTPGYMIDTYSQDFIQCIEQTHTSWMINNAAFRAGGGYTGTQLDGAKAAALAMGYEYSVPQMSVSAFGLHQGTVDLRFSIEITNTGVAPFYYPLTLRLKDNLGNTSTLADDLHTLLPQQTRHLHLELTDVSPDYLAREFRLSFASSVLLTDQVIRFADDGDLEGELLLAPQFGCDINGQRRAVGEEVDGCYCDVDGRMIDGSAQLCQ